MSVARELLIVDASEERTARLYIECILTVETVMTVLSSRIIHVQTPPIRSVVKVQY